MGVPKVIGEYRRSPKNEIVREHYPRLGFMPNENGFFELLVEGFIPKQHFIKETANPEFRSLP
jgi:hypothetical protein